MCYNKPADLLQQYLAKNFMEEREVFKNENKKNYYHNNGCALCTILFICYDSKCKD